MPWFHGPFRLNDVAQWPNQFNEINSSKDDENIFEVRKDFVNF